MKRFPLLFVLIALVSMQPGTARADVVLITGATRGIGLEFAKEYAAAGWNVIATYRGAKVPDSLSALAISHPRSVVTERMDVTDLMMIDAVAQRYKGKPIDVLINNAAVVGNLQNSAEQEFGRLRHDLFDEFMRTNVQGPLKVSEAFLENVRQGRRKVIVMISSAAGSFTASATNRPGRVYYKVSKAAANMAMQSVATATQPDGIIVVALHPGGVRVEKLRGMDVPGFMEPEQSVSSMIRVIDALTIKQTGSFLNFDGKPLPW